MKSVKSILKTLIELGLNRKPTSKFPGSDIYWNNRYKTGGNSGVGSYGRFAQFKADTLNKFIEDNDIKEIIEFGCGDGNQLSYFKFPHYIGFDVSPVILNACQEKFKEDEMKEFYLMSDYKEQQAELTLSLDVIFHLVEDDVFNSYMRRLFGASSRFVGIYSSNSDENPNEVPCHVRNRCFTDWVSKKMPEWELVKKIDNKYPYDGDYREGSWSDFYFFENQKMF